MSGIRVDAQWYGHWLHEDKQRCDGFGHGSTSRIQKVQLVTDVFLLQAVGVAKGLDYLHDRGVVHGDLKGVRTITSICKPVI